MFLMLIAESAVRLFLLFERLLLTEAKKKAWQYYCCYFARVSWASFCI
jgi:hypothetical protein